MIPSAFPPAVRAAPGPAPGLELGGPCLILVQKICSGGAILAAEPRPSCSEKVWSRENSLPPSPLLDHPEIIGILGDFSRKRAPAPFPSPENHSISRFYSHFPSFYNSSRSWGSSLELFPQKRVTLQNSQRQGTAPGSLGWKDFKALLQSAINDLFM